MSEATICAIQDKLYQNLADFEERSKQQLISSAVIHNDETGVSVEGKREWAHVTSTEEVTHYAIDPREVRRPSIGLAFYLIFTGSQSMIAGDPISSI